MRYFLLTLVFLVLSGCKVVLYSEISESEANRMISVLEREGIFATKEAVKDGVNILVEETLFGRAVEILEAAGLPSQTFTSVNEVFAAEGIVVTPLQERAKLNYAKSQELASAISDMAGVVTAHVQIADGSLEDDSSEAGETMVSVMVRVNDESAAATIVPKVKEMVVFSVPKASYDRVGVVTSAVSGPAGEAKYDQAFGIDVLDGSQGTVRTLVYSTFASVGLLVAVILANLGYFIYRRSGRKSQDA